MWKHTRWSESWRHTLDWCEKHAGLGGWVGALGAAVANILAWGLARSEYLRLQRVEDARVNAEIALIIRTASDFDPIVRQYILLYRANDPEAKNYYNRQLNDSRMSRMIDFNTTPIAQWPSVESYDAFKRYFLSSMTLMERSVDVDKSIDIEQRIKVYEGTLGNLQNALDIARK
jgi:hypothetical protein